MQIKSIVKARLLFSPHQYNNQVGPCEILESKKKDFFYTHENEDRQWVPQ